MGLTHTKLHHRVMQENWASISRRLQTEEGQQWARTENPCGDYPLHLACYDGKAPPRIVRDLVKACPEALEHNNRLGRKPFELARANYREDHPYRKGVLEVLAAAYSDRLQGELREVRACELDGKTIESSHSMDGSSGAASSKEASSDDDNGAATPRTREPASTGASHPPTPRPLPVPIDNPYDLDKYCENCCEVRGQRYMCLPYDEPEVRVALLCSILAWSMSWIWWVSFLLSGLGMIAFQPLWYRRLSKCSVCALVVVAIFNAILSLGIGAHVASAFSGMSSCVVFTALESYNDDYAADVFEFYSDYNRDYYILYNPRIHSVDGIALYDVYTFQDESFETQTYVRYSDVFPGNLPTNNIDLSEDTCPEMLYFGLALGCALLWAITAAATVWFVATDKHAAWERRHGGGAAAGEAAPEAEGDAEGPDGPEREASSTEDVEDRGGGDDAASRTDANLEDKVQQVRKILPQFGEVFVETTLHAHQGDVDATVATLLHHSSEDEISAPDSDSDSDSSSSIPAPDSDSSSSIPAPDSDTISDLEDPRAPDPPAPRATDPWQTQTQSRTLDRHEAAPERIAHQMAETTDESSARDAEEEDEDHNGPSRRGSDESDTTSASEAKSEANRTTKDSRKKTKKKKKKKKKTDTNAIGESEVGNADNAPESDDNAASESGSA